MGSLSPGGALQGGGPSPKRKIPKGFTFNLNDDATFPGMKTTSPICREMYLRITSKIEGKKMVNLNRFKLEFFLNKITKNYSKASFNKEGDLVLRVKDALTAERLMKTTTIGDYRVEILRHETLNCCKGVIFCPDIIDMPEDEIKEGLALFHPVRDIYIPKRVPKSNGNFHNYDNLSPRPYGIVIITFDQLEAPAKVNVGFRKVEVRPYVPSPRKCRGCQKLGHSAKFCPTSQLICSQCGLELTEGHSCIGKACVNCNNNEHSSSDPKCPKWLMAKEVESIMVLEKKSKFEARKTFYERHGDEIKFTSSKNMNMAERLKAATQQMENAPQDSIKPTTTNNNANSSTLVTNNQHSEKTNISKRTKTTPTSTTTPTTSTNISDQEVELIEISHKKASNNANSRLSLINWEERKDDISFYLKNLCIEGTPPKLDLKKFKNPKETEIKFTSKVKEIFDLCQENINTVVKMQPKPTYVEIKISQGLTTVRPIYGNLIDKLTNPKNDGLKNSPAGKGSDIEMIDQ